MDTILSVQSAIAIRSEPRPGRRSLPGAYEEGGGGGANLVAGGDQTSRRPLAVAAMRARHVIGNGRMAAQVGRAGVAGDPLTLVEDLDGVVGDAHIDEFADEAVGRGIPVPVDLDMIVGRDAAPLPAQSVWLVRQLSRILEP